MDSLSELLAIVIFLAVGAVFVRMIAANIQNIAARRKSPNVSVAAKLSKKLKNVGQSTFGSDGVRLGKKTFTVVFETDDGEELEFAISEYEFGELIEGERGYLTYRGKQFLGFAPDMLLKDGVDI